MQHIIDKKLQDNDCPVASFVPITGGLIGRTRLTQALQGEPGKNLDRNLEDKLIALLDEMLELKRTSLVAPDWSDAQGIREQLAARREVRKLFRDDADAVRLPLGIE